MKTTTAMLVLIAALALAACGSGGGESATTTAPTAAGGAAKPSAPSIDEGEGRTPAPGHDNPASGDTSASFTPPAHRDSRTGSAGFEVKGGDNSIQEFGTEASGAEFQAAASALHGYLDARAAMAWTDACSYLLPGAAASLVQLGGGGSGKGGSCADALASFSTRLSPADLREAAEAEVAALRTEGDHGFLLFHAAGDGDYFVPMTREGGAWKVAAIAPSALL